VLNDAAMDVLIVLGAMATAYLLYRFILYKRRTGGNTALWGTVFEALTHYVQPLETLKEPKQYINRTQKRSDKGPDDEDEEPPSGVN